MAWSNSIAYGANATVPVVRMNSVPTEHVALTTPHGRVTATAAADATVREDVISMTHGHTAANPGDLTSGDIGVDSLTAMPLVSGLAVEVTPAIDPV
jgi:hypothetical protein